MTASMSTGKRLRGAAKDLRRSVQSYRGRRLLSQRGEDASIIVMVDGGLCSVMTKYVLGECFRKHLGADVKYDLSWFESSGLDCDGKPTRPFTLTKLFPQIEMPVAEPEDLAFYKQYFHLQNPQPYTYNTSLFETSGPLYVDGYAENWRYFADVEDEVLAKLTFDKLPLNEANTEVLNDIAGSDTAVAVHVRRGDYVNLGMASLGRDYYLSAIAKIAEMTGAAGLMVYFFSDDIEWVRANIASALPEHVSSRCVDVNGVDAGHLDLYLISKCDHQISSNSSFGYWGGLLNTNPGKIVIVPERWLPGEERSVELAGCDDAHSYPGFLKLENNPSGS